MIKLERGKTYPARYVIEALIRHHRGNRAADEYRKKWRNATMVAPPNTAPSFGNANTGKASGAAAPPPNSANQAAWEPGLDDDMVLDWDGVDASSTGGDQDVIPAGFHLFYVESIDATESKNGKPMFKIGFRGESGEADGLFRYGYITLEKSSLWKLAQFMQACGIPAEEIPTLTRNQIRDRTKGTYLGIEVRSTVYEGNPSCDLKTFRDPSAFGVEPGSKKPPVGSPT